MDKHKKSLIILVFINIMVACFVQVICSPIIIEKIDMPLFQFVVLPLALVLVNVAMALKFNLKFYQYLVSAYVGFWSSIVVFAFIILILKRPEELPPGEIVLGADLVFIYFISFVQFVTLLFLNLIVYVLYKAYKVKLTKVLKSKFGHVKKPRKHC